MFLNVMSGENSIIWGFQNGKPLTAERCSQCDGRGFFSEGSVGGRDCNHCSGRGWFGIDPRLPVQGRPGSREKIAMLTVRYASGVPLWNDADGATDEAHARRLAL
jgi:hypothetical protein